MSLAGKMFRWLTDLGSQVKVRYMTHSPNPDVPHLYDQEGKLASDPAADAEIHAAFSRAMAEGGGEPSPPLTLWWSLSRPDGGVHMRLTLEDRWTITDVYVHGHGLTATDLQAVPLTELDLLVNLVGGYDPWTVADAFNEMACEGGWGQAVLAADPYDGEEPTLAELRQLAVNAPDALPAPSTTERPRLTRPDGTDPDGFSARVAAAYREYAPKTRAPAVEIANEAGVPVATARSWIREARRRGKLPQGRKGKAG